MITLLVSFLSASAAVNVRVAAERAEVQFSIDRVEEQRVVEGHRSLAKLSLIGVEGFAGVYFSQGEPMLPSVNWIARGDGDISVEWGAPERLQGNSIVVPARPSPAKNILSTTAFTFSAVYLKNAFFPTLSIDIRDMGMERGIRRRLIRLMPLRYNPVTGEYELYRQFKLLVPHTEEARPKRLALVVAPNLVGSRSLEKYKAFKQSQGFQVTRVSLSDRETPDGIRMRLQALLREWDLGYAILVGKGVPSKESSRMNGTTDHFYRCLDTDNYETDIGSPDIGVGRLAARDETELDEMISRLMAYQRGLWKLLPSSKSAAFVASDDSRFWSIAEFSHNQVIERFIRQLGWQGGFPESNEPGGDRLYAVSHQANGERLLDVLKSGRAIIDYSGHGEVDSWSGPRLSASDLRSVDPKVAWPIVTAFACKTARFVEEDSLAEVWQRHSAVIYLGSMSSSFWDEDDIMEREMYGVLFGDTPTTADDFLSTGLTAVWRHYGGENRSAYYWENYVFFGDPSMQLWLQRTSPLPIFF